MFRRTERFVIGILTVGLILLITVQLMMQTEETKSTLVRIESKLHALIGQEVEEVAMMNSDGFVTLKLMNQGYFPQARVLVNNERAYYFKGDTIKIPVNNSDMLIIDTRGISHSLSFRVVDHSTSITSLQQGLEIRVCDSLSVFPIQMDRTRF